MLTLQFGHYANYAAAHLWNLRAADEAHAGARSLLFRSDSAPRAVVFDAHGAVGPLSLSVAAGPPPPSALADARLQAWSGAVSAQVAQPPPRALFLRRAMTSQRRGGAAAGAAAPAAAAGGARAAEGGAPAPAAEGEDVDVEALIGEDVHVEALIESWTDFVDTDLHSRTVCELSGVRQGLDAFDGFEQGYSLIAPDSDEFEEAMDRVRFFAEECDHVVGFQCIADADTGFAGLGSFMLEQIRDEYERKPIITYGVTTVRHTERTAKMIDKEAACEGRAVHAFSSLSTLYVPLSCKHLQASSFPGLEANLGNWYHSSALLGMALDTCSFPYSLTGREDYDMLSYASHLRVGSTSFATAELFLAGAKTGACMAPFVAPVVAPSRAACVEVNRGAQPFSSGASLFSRTMAVSEDVRVRLPRAFPGMFPGLPESTGVAGRVHTHVAPWLRGIAGAFESATRRANDFALREVLNDLQTSVDTYTLE
eukprot:m51a1_g4579 hypothetical protein (482) ;mRNA; f:168673-170681